MACPMPRLAPVTMPVIGRGFRISDVGFREIRYRILELAAEAEIVPLASQLAAADNSPEIRHPKSEILLRRPASEILSSYLDRGPQRETDAGFFPEGRQRLPQHAAHPPPLLRAR